MNSYQETMYLLKKYHLTASKKLGQNFLIDDEVIAGIVDAAQITKEDLVIEIGPGLGTLTQCLLEKAKKVIAIELDTRMITILQDRFKLYSNFTVIEQDILKVNLQKLIEQENCLSVKIVANLPYYITTPIVMKLLEDKLPVASITIMVQKEVAQRLTAKTGERLSGSITYAIDYYSKARNILTVPSKSFIPEPKVDSQVIQLQIRDNPCVKVKDEKLFFEMIQLAFMQRRKTFLNAVSQKIEKTTMQKILQNLHIDENIRGENLTIEQFAEITNQIFEKMLQANKKIDIIQEERWEKKA